MKDEKILSKTRAGVLAQYRLGKYRERRGVFVAEGAKAVGDILAVARPVGLVLRGNARVPAKWMPRLGDAEILRATAEQMARISTLSTPSDYYCLFERPAEPDAADGSLPEALYLMLDGVRDPGNLGTIVRTAHWFGIRRIYASPDTVDLYNPKTVMSTMGSLGHVEVVYRDLAEVIAANPTLPVYGLLLDGRDIYRAPLGGSGFIIMGNEGQGISERIRSLVTDPLLIPPGNPAEHGESLNVAIATAVTLSQFRSRPGS